MPTLLRSTKPRARKPHRCSDCYATIPVGMTYRRDTFVYDGHAYDWLVCPDCAPIESVVWRWADPFGDEGIGPETYEDWAREHRDDPEHGEAASALLARIHRWSVTPEGDQL